MDLVTMTGDMMIYVVVYWNRMLLVGRLTGGAHLHVDHQIRLTTSEHIDRVQSSECNLGLGIVVDDSSGFRRQRRRRRFGVVDAP